MGKVVIERLPGGTNVRLDRPWQVDIRVDPRTCPLENSGERPLQEFETGWRLLLNKHTPFPWHRLLVPEKCWPKDRIRSLGGPRQIESVLRIVEEITNSELSEFWLGVHVGPSAGQNIAHVHYHLLKPIRSNSKRLNEVPKYYSSLPNKLLQEGGFKVVLGGLRAGQCFVLPISKQPRRSEWVPDLANILHRLITLFAEKFRSVQDLPPDYIIAVRLLGSKIVYASFIPILNNWGFTEYLGLLERTPVILPWSPEQTASLLTAERK